MTRTLTIIALLISSQLFAQSPGHQIELGYGASLQNTIIKGLLKLKNDVDVDGTSVLLAGYEYRATDWVGIGVGFTKQSLTGSYSYEIDLNQLQFEDTISFNYSRFALVLEPRIYYPLGIDWLEIYSSIRLGYKNSDIDGSSTNNNVDELLKLTNLIGINPFNASITPLGVNLFPNEHIGLSFAGNLGPTYFIKASLLLRI